jgi:hypothetical protein
VLGGSHVRDLCDPGVLRFPRSVAASHTLIAVAGSEECIPVADARVHVFSAVSRVLLQVLACPGTSNIRGVRISRDDRIVMLAAEPCFTLPIQAAGSPHSDHSRLPVAWGLPRGYSCPYDVEECEDGWLTALVGGEVFMFIPHAVAHNGSPPDRAATRVMRLPGLSNPNSVLHVDGLGLVVRDGKMVQVGELLCVLPVLAAAVVVDTVALVVLCGVVVGDWGVMEWATHVFYGPLVRLLLPPLCCQVLLLPDGVLMNTRMSMARVAWMTCVYRGVKLRDMGLLSHPKPLR